MASFVVVCGVSQPSVAHKIIGGVEMRDGFEGSDDWGLYCSSGCITTIVFNTLNGLSGRLRSLRLSDTIGCWFPNPYEIVGSLESDSIITFSGSCEATEDTVMASHANAPDSCVELRSDGVLGSELEFLLLTSAPHKKRQILWMKNQLNLL